MHSKRVQLTKGKKFDPPLSFPRTFVKQPGEDKSSPCTVFEKGLFHLLASKWWVTNEPIVLALRFSIAKSNLLWRDMATNICNNSSIEFTLKIREFSLRWLFSILNSNNDEIPRFERFRISLCRNCFSRYRRSMYLSWNWDAEWTGEKVSAKIYNRKRNCEHEIQVTFWTR